jgi:putative ABC transport system permease protein
MAESFVIGLISAVVSVILIQVGLFIVRSRPDGYAALARADMQMMFATVAAAVLSLLIAGAIPAWQLRQANLAENLNGQ